MSSLDFRVRTSECGGGLSHQPSRTQESFRWHTTYRDERVLARASRFSQRRLMYQSVALLLTYLSLLMMGVVHQIFCSSSLRECESKGMRILPDKL